MDFLCLSALSAGNKYKHMNKIKSETYDIFFAEKHFSQIENFLQNTDYQSAKKIILVDENTKCFCLPELLKNVKTLNVGDIIEIKSGEKHKTIDDCRLVWDKLIQLKAGRDSIVINLGGGMLSDLGGFVSSTFKRGIPYINIPTTLLAMVDASVGGKTAVNFSELKNQIGVFSNPRAVFIIPEFLKNLPENQLLSGYAEVIKHALIADKKYWVTIKNTNILSGTKFMDLIIPSIEIKNKIVGLDPFEKGDRKKLNFGHTFGHAFETISHKQDKALLHGEAIAMGMICEVFISHKIAGLSQGELQEIISHILKHFKLYIIQKQQFNTLIEIMSHDKKNSRDEINFTLLNSIGQSEFNRTCKTSLILETLDFYNNLS